MLSISIIPFLVWLGLGHGNPKPRLKGSMALIIFRILGRVDNRTPYAKCHCQIGVVSGLMKLVQLVLMWISYCLNILASTWKKKQPNLKPNPSNLKSSQADFCHSEASLHQLRIHWNFWNRLSSFPGFIMGHEQRIMIVKPSSWYGLIMESYDTYT